jgi:hypothetical protein
MPQVVQHGAAVWWHGQQKEKGPVEGSMGEGEPLNREERRYKSQLQTLYLNGTKTSENSGIAFAISKKSHKLIPVCSFLFF